MTEQLDKGTETPASPGEQKAGSTAGQAWWMDHVRELVMGPGGSATQKPAKKTAPARKPEPPAPDAQSPEAHGKAQPDPDGPNGDSDPDVLDQALQGRALEKLEACSDRVEELAEELRGAVRGLSDLTSAVHIAQSPNSTDADDLGFDSDPVPGDAGVVGLLGSTTCVPTWAILELLSANRKSGTLRIVSDSETFTLEILEGDVVHASSDQSTHEQLLGSILVARDKIGVEQLDDFYKRFTPGTGGPAEGGGLVSTEDLKSALEAEVQELFNRAHAAEAGAYSFFEGERSNVEQRIRMNVTRLLLESARNADELDQQTRNTDLERNG